MTSGAWLVVLNWNGRDDTLELLASLDREPATVLVVDNGSEDGTLQAVEAQFPRVRTLQTGANLGYAGGNNAGIEYALAEGADVVGVLNNDTMVDPGFLKPLMAVLSRSNNLAVSPDIRYADRPDVSWFRGSRIDARTGWPQHASLEHQLPPDTDEIATPVLTGCCIVAGADVWRRVGTFDDGMFLMFEDSDWSRRAIERGVRLLVVPGSRIRHKVSRSFTGASAVLGAYYFARNGTVFAWRHLGAVPTLRFLARQVFRPSIRQVLDAKRRPAAVMSYLGVLAAVGHHRGAAGPIPTAYARRVVAAISENRSTSQ